MALMRGSKLRGTLRSMQNIGRPLRSRSASCTIASVSTKPVAAVEPITMSASGRYFGEVLERHRRAAEVARQLDGAVERAVGDHHVADAVAEQMARRQLAHLAGADQHRGLVLETVEDRARQLDRRRADRHRAAGDAGLGAHPLGDRERLVEPAVQHRAGGADAGGAGVELLQLAEDLRLADHHRVEARGDAEEMADRVAPASSVEMRRQIARRAALRARRNSAMRSTTPPARARAADHLDPVAGADDGRLVDALERRRAGG